MVQSYGKPEHELIQKQHQKLERSNSQELVKMEKKQQISTKDIIM